MIRRWSGADRLLVRPAVVLLRQAAVGEVRSGAVPEVRPVAPVGDGARRIPPAARDEAREPGTPGRLADRVVPQVEAPADAVAVVGQRGVLGLVVEEEHPAAIDWQG